MFRRDAQLEECNRVLPLRGHGRVMGAPHAMVAERSVRYLSRTLRCSLASAADRITRGRNRHAHGVAGLGADTHAPGMFAITEAEAAAIRVAFQQSGELSAADSDEAARVYRALSAHRSNLMAPTILI